MNNQKGIAPVAIIFIILFLVAGGVFAWQYFGTPEEEKETPAEEFVDETADWQTYQWNSLEFEYPQTWTIEKIYYQTPAQQARGESPENIGLKMFPGIESIRNDFISIGGRQVSCDPSEKHTKCQFIPLISDFIYTDSNNLDILNTFDKIISTFRFLGAQEEVSGEEEMMGAEENLEIEKRDNTRQADIRQISTALLMYHSFEGRYVQLKNMPNSIETYLDPVPKDPLGYSYHWLDNTDGATTNCGSQSYCAWAELEESGYLAASEKGVKLLADRPIKCPCW